MSTNGPNVHIVGGNQWGEGKIFLARNWNVVDLPSEADFLCWTGGADISPELYGQKRLPRTGTNPRRDAYEVKMFESFPEKNKLGICRGGQLLNALSGGDMWQDVNNHGRTHIAIDVASGEEIFFSSVHHQMMIPGDGAQIIAIAHEATFKEKEKLVLSIPDDKLPETDIEALYYEATKSFCFQPHPEWGPEDCTEYFFKKISSLYGV